MNMFIFWNSVKQAGHSHLTHQREGVLENSFPRRFQSVIERVLADKNIFLKAF